MTNHKLIHLFNSAAILIKKEDEIRKAKGETFNVFSILGMETKENKTHSNFIGNMLDPKGTHLMGAKFLELFLDQIGAIDQLDAETTNVTLEFSCGPNNIQTKTGGRIDIFLSDGTGRSLSIENKIHAIDQPHQIERYVNYNKEKNKVYYLTLYGNEATKESKGTLKSGEDYFLISYQVDIVRWLEKCTKESANEPILRESIKQYRILIQKLTNTMDKTQNKELQDLIIDNYDAAELVARNFDLAKEQICSSFRNAVLKGINEFLKSTSYKAELGTKITTTYAQIWIRNESNRDSKIFFGIEPFGTSAADSLFVGTFTYGDNEFDQLESVNRYNQYWSNIETFPTLEGVELRMNNGEFLKRLSISESYNSKVVDHIVDFFKTYFQVNKSLIESYLSGKV